MQRYLEDMDLPYHKRQLYQFLHVYLKLLSPSKTQEYIKVKIEDYLKDKAAGRLRALRVKYKGMQEVRVSYEHGGVQEPESKRLHPTLRLEDKDHRC